MTKQTTRMKEYSQNQTVLFTAFELGNSEWKLGFSVGLGQKARMRTIQAGDSKRLQREFAAAKKRFGLDGKCRIVSCYEAGRDGFWLHRYRAQSGVENLVVDSSSIEVNRKARRAKADGLDVAKLLTMLIRYHHGEHKVWSVVRAPSVEDVGGGEKMVHFGGQMAHLRAKHFRPASGVKAARKCAEGLALTPLDKAGTQSFRVGQVVRHFGPFSNRH